MLQIQFKFNNYNFELFTTYKMFRTSVVSNNLDRCILSFFVLSLGELFDNLYCNS